MHKQALRKENFLATHSLSSCPPASSITLELQNIFAPLFCFILQVFSPTLLPSLAFTWVFLTSLNQPFAASGELKTPRLCSSPGYFHLAGLLLLVPFWPTYPLWSSASSRHRLGGLVLGSPFTLLSPFLSLHSGSLLANLQTSPPTLDTWTNTGLHASVACL